MSGEFEPKATPAPKQVISYEDGKKILDQLKELQEWKENGDESTKLELSERADDMAKAVERVNEISEEMEKMQRDFADEQRKARLEAGDGAKRQMLDRFKGGYRAPAGADDPYAAKTTAPPDIKTLISGAQLRTGEFYVPEHEDLHYLRELNDSALITAAFMQASDPHGFAARGGMESLDVVKELRRAADAMFKADGDSADTTALANMVPTYFSSVLYDTVRLATPEIAAFPEITMPGAKLDLNVNLTDPEGTYQAEVTAISEANPFADFNVQALSETKVTLEAKKARSRVVFSGEIEEDAIIAQLPWYRSLLIEGMSNALADAIINGDEAATARLDNTASSDTHFGKACPAAGVDARLMWDGLRWMAQANTATPDTSIDYAGADLDAAGIGAVWATMGEYGVNANDQLLTICSPTGYINLVQDAKFITKDLMGDMATLITGAIGKVWNIPVMVSRRYPQNLTATDQKIGTSGANKTGAILVRRDKCILGNRRRMTMGMDTYGATDAKDIYLFWRGDFEDLMPVTVPWIGSLYDVATV